VKSEKLKVKSEELLFHKQYEKDDYPNTALHRQQYVDASR
jgi:hypothetical protein